MTDADETLVVWRIIRQALHCSDCVGVERVLDGVLTRVYRVRRTHDVLYLRILPEDGASFAPEVLVHQLLRARGASVPEVLYFEHNNPLLLRSVMVTTEVPGQAATQGTSAADLPGILAEAGRDLAIVNSIPVRGFGWIGRDSARVERLEAEFGDRGEWIRRDVADSMDALERAGVLDKRNAQAIRAIFTGQVELLGSGTACLAHGDFDSTHVFHRDGKYTGIIDFGEIRGTNQFYDLGHFQIERPDLLPYLLEGYGIETRLPPDHMQRIHLSSLLSATWHLGRRSAKTRCPDAYIACLHGAIERAIAVLLA